MDSLLEQYKVQMGYRLITIPQKFEIEKMQMYNVGLLKELAEDIIILPKGQAVELNFEALTSSNVSTIHQACKKKGYRLHCLRNGNKRVLYVDKLNG